LFHARCRSSFRLHNRHSRLLGGGSPVESLQSHWIHTQFQWSSGQPVCFPSWGTRVQSSGGYLYETRILLLSLSRYSLLLCFYMITFEHTGCKCCLWTGFIYHTNKDLYMYISRHKSSNTRSLSRHKNSNSGSTYQGIRIVTLHPRIVTLEKYQCSHGSRHENNDRASTYQDIRIVTANLCIET
jgi:hypothetical protein